MSDAGQIRDVAASLAQRRGVAQDGLARRNLQDSARQTTGVPHQGGLVHVDE